MNPSGIKIAVRLYLSFFLSVVQFNRLTAQLSSRQFERLSKKEGLSSNWVNDVIQDREGFYWIATANGLNRFDGSSFTTFLHDRKDTTSISHNNCQALTEGNDGDIWIATYNGICRYQKNKGTFHRYYLQHPSFNSDLLNRVYEITKDKDGIIWATSFGLWRIHPGYNIITPYVHDRNNPSSVSDSLETSLLSLDRVNNGLWFKTEDAVNYYDLASRQFVHYRNNPSGWPVFKKRKIASPFAVNNNGSIFWYDDEEQRLYRHTPGKSDMESVYLPLPHPVYYMHSAGMDSVWINFSLEPSVLYDWKNKQAEAMPLPEQENSLYYSRMIKRAYTDKNGNRWLCTNEGLYVIEAAHNGMDAYRIYDNDTGLPVIVNSMCRDAGNRLWLSTTKGLCFYDLSNRKLTKMPQPVFHQSVRSLFNAGDSILWVGLKGEADNIVLLDLKVNRIIKSITLRNTPYFITADSNGHRWVGTWDKGLVELDAAGNLTRQYTTKDGLPYDGILSCYNEAGKTLWIGLNGGMGYTQFDISTKKFTHHRVVGQQSDAANTINAIVKDKAGNLWLGTFGSGLYQYNESTKEYTNYRQSDGLSGDYINTLSFDAKGNLWISTAVGVDIMNGQTKQITHLSKSLQCLTNDLQNNYAAGDNGLKYYSGLGKLVTVDPVEYINTDKDIPVLISSFKISGKENTEAKHTRAIRLPYDQNFFSVEYSALRINPAMVLNHSYKLAGFDADWNFTGNRGSVRYTNVPPGTYTLLLNVTNESGNWNKTPLAFRVTIAPPFWQTWWFLLAVGSAVVCILIIAVSARIKWIRKKQQERLRLVVATQEQEQKSIAGELHDHLGVRLSSLKYFIASLKNYISPGDTVARETYNKTMVTIDESVEEIRYLLINLSPKTLNEYGYLVAVEDLVNKLTRTHVINVNLSQKNMESRLQPEVEAGLYRITQELVNNTLKHASAGIINLGIERGQDFIRLDYDDDGKGYNPSRKSEGYGLANIRTRVILLNGKMEWKNMHGKCTRLSIVIPYTHTKV